MLDARRIGPEDVRRVPWRNGRGVTDELALGPPDASFEALDFDWRVAAAAVDADGPFSLFPGFERVLVVLGGAGLHLRHGPAQPWRRLAPLVPCTFPGEAATEARLVDGPVRDLSVLVRRGRATAEVRVERPGPAGPVDVAVPPGDALLHAVHGPVEVGEPGVAAGRVWRLPPGESLRLCGLEASVGLSLRGAPPAALVVIALGRRARCPEAQGMSSTVTTTVRCGDCARQLAVYHGVPRGPDARARLAQASRELLEWHRASVPTCKASGVRFADRAEPR